MSRIGKLPITLPKGVSFDMQGTTVTVKGPKGQLSQSFNPDIKMSVEDGVVTVTRPSDQSHHKALHGLTRALVNNMVLGVSNGFEKKLKIEGVGYRAEMSGKTLILNVGYSHPVNIEPPTPDTVFSVEDRGKSITVVGIDKQVVGEISALIRKQRPPEPYKGKGIRYLGEHVRRKAGKAGKV
ncbi:MAG TPA: 50S ribosomal protein L6 [Anaerolineae bacterium]|nr:50S ribosomal protein L6 [Anaerolineae bacterium]